MFEFIYDRYLEFFVFKKIYQISIGGITYRIYQDPCSQLFLINRDFCFFIKLWYKKTFVDIEKAKKFIENDRG